MSCGRLFPRLPGHLITFRQSFLVFTQGYIYNSSIFQCRPADAATQAEPLFFFPPFNGSFQVGSQTIPARWLFFSSGSHQICISSSESSVYLTLHSRASAVHLTLIRFRSKAGAKMARRDQMFFFSRKHRGAWAQGWGGGTGEDVLILRNCDTVLDNRALRNEQEKLPDPWNFLTYFSQVHPHVLSRTN